MITDLFHYEEDFQIKEIGLKLDQQTRSKIKHRLRLLQEKAPAISTTTLTFIQDKDHLKGSLSNRSLTRNFRCIAKGPDPLRVYQQLEIKMKAQIEQWRNDRFKINTALKDTAV